MSDLSTPVHRTSGRDDKVMVFSRTVIIINPSKFYFMGNSVVENRAAGSRQAVVQRYVDILTDAGLKAVFGDQRNKDVLIDIEGGLR